MRIFRSHLFAFLCECELLGCLFMMRLAIINDHLYSVVLAPTLRLRIFLHYFRSPSSLGLVLVTDSTCSLACWLVIFHPPTIPFSAFSTYLGIHWVGSIDSNFVVIVLPSRSLHHSFDVLLWCSLAVTMWLWETTALTFNGDIHRSTGMFNCHVQLHMDDLRFILLSSLSWLPSQVSSKPTVVVLCLM